MQGSSNIFDKLDARAHTCVVSEGRNSMSHFHSSPYGVIFHVLHDDTQLQSSSSRSILTQQVITQYKNVRKEVYSEHNVTLLCVLLRGTLNTLSYLK